MFIRIEEEVINLSLVEQIIFGKQIISVCFTSKDSIFIDLKHAGKLEKALSKYNKMRGYKHDWRI